MAITDSIQGKIRPNLTTTLIAASFLATAPAANWLIGNVGTTCIPGGPCLIPVGFGLSAPSGVLLIGVALALRDVLQERIGRAGIVALVLAGAALSFGFSPADLAVASAVAFGISEAGDFLVYDRLRKQSMWVAVLASGFVGAAVDSAAFSYLAFGAVKWAPGLVLAKMYASAAWAACVAVRRLRVVV